MSESRRHVLVEIGYCEKLGHRIPIFFSLDQYGHVTSVSNDCAICRRSARCELYNRHPIGSVGYPEKNLETLP